MSSKRSAIATIFMLVCSNIDEITLVPLFPQPIIPIRIAEFALDAKAIDGLRMVAAEIAVVLLIKFLRFRCVIMDFVF